MSRIKNSEQLEAWIEAGRQAIEDALLDLNMLSEVPLLMVVGKTGSGKSLILEACSKAWNSVEYVDAALHFKGNDCGQLKDKGLFVTDAHTLIVDEIGVCDPDVLSRAVTEALTFGSRVILTAQTTRVLESMALPAYRLLELEWQSKRPFVTPEQSRAGVLTA